MNEQESKLRVLEQAEDRLLKSCEPIAKRIRSQLYHHNIPIGRDGQEFIEADALYAEALRNWRLSVGSKKP